ncbi:MAG: hypothetical protein ACI8PG_002105, partial [Planctomycetota bacterium]
CGPQTALVLFLQGLPIFENGEMSLEKGIGVRG